MRGESGLSSGQDAALETLGAVCSMVSLCGSLFVLISFAAIRDLRERYVLKLIACLAFCDAMTSLGNLLSASLAPGHGLLGRSPAGFLAAGGGEDGSARCTYVLASLPPPRGPAGPLLPPVVFQSACFVIARLCCCNQSAPKAPHGCLTARPMSGAPPRASTQAYIISYFTLASVLWITVVAYALDTAVHNPIKALSLAQRDWAFHLFAWVRPPQARAGARVPPLQHHHHSGPLTRASPLIPARGGRRRACRSS